MSDHNRGCVRLAVVTAIVATVCLSSRSALGGSDRSTTPGKARSVEQRAPVVEGAVHHDVSPRQHRRGDGGELHGLAWTLHSGDPVDFG